MSMPERLSSVPRMHEPWTPGTTVVSISCDGAMLPGMELHSEPGKALETAEDHARFMVRMRAWPSGRYMIRAGKKRQTLELA